MKKLPIRQYQIKSIATTPPLPLADGANAEPPRLRPSLSIPSHTHMCAHVRGAERERMTERDTHTHRAGGSYTPSLSRQQSMASTAAVAPKQPVLVKNERGKSAVWRYFAFLPNEQGKPKDVDKPVCKHCHKVVATKSSSMSNLAKHQDRHPGLYNEF